MSSWSSLATPQEFLQLRLSAYNLFFIIIIIIIIIIFLSELNTLLQQQLR